MDYHIVPNLTGSDQKVRRRHQHHGDLNDWHFEAVLLGAAILVLFLPLITFLLPGREVRVLGTSTPQTERVYDSEMGYYEKESN
jgi:hypothetical protein